MKQVQLHSTRNERIARQSFTKFDRYFKFKQFLSHVDVGDPEDCWNWKGEGASNKSNGYGTFHWADKGICQAHVASYVLFVGKIPKKHGKKLYVCHSCDNPGLRES